MKVCQSVTTSDFHLQCNIFLDLVLEVCTKKTGFIKNLGRACSNLVTLITCVNTVNTAGL